MYRQKSFENDVPTLYLVPTPIGNLGEMTSRSLEILSQVNYIACEDTRQTSKLKNHFNLDAKLVSHHEHNLKSAIPKIIKLLETESVALVSDAGYPAISDPGYELVQEAISLKIPVVPLSGCNAALDALVVSGIAPQPFVFYGFLSHENSKKKKELESLKNNPYTLIFYEAPHRIMKTLQAMYGILGDRHIALCRELTKRHEEIIRGTISELLTLTDLKGEMVLVVEGGSVEEDVEFDMSVTEHVQYFINKGMKTKDASKEVASLRGLKKNEVYQEYIKNKG